MSAVDFCREYAWKIANRSTSSAGKEVVCGNEAHSESMRTVSAYQLDDFALGSTDDSEPDVSADFVSFERFLLLLLRCVQPYRLIV